MSAPKWEWKLPRGADGSARPQLQLFNSYNNRAVPFIPAAGPHSKQISWYTCGPTVYEVSHMGHARNYLTSDVIRRVLEDYFGYNIHFVMNVTDVDDKIIIKARRAHHLQRFRNSSPQPDEVRERVKRALQDALQKQQQAAQQLEQGLQAAEAKAAKQPDSATLQKATEDVRSRLSLAQTAINRTQDQQQQLAQDCQAGAQGQAAADALIDTFGSVLAEALDAQGDDVDITDHAVFQQHVRRYEADFMRDMDDLGVRRPTAMPRVSEYVPEIVAYIETIMQKGLAYEANGSVYFNTCAFEAAGHQYRKLSPTSATAADELAGDGEADFSTSEKRNPRDFALWKASKPGEPTWPSPWGRGRPGWHIECSAMASQLIGSHIDIHTGGVDLRFPHHDNEIAQAEAYYHGQQNGACDCNQWVNYFLHLGHLHIEGLKMSKSLKNFITIREALGSFTARQLRLMMCLQPWNAPMTFGEQAKEAMVAREKELRNFFGNVVSTLRETDAQVAQRACSTADSSHRWHSTRWQAEELELNAQLQTAQAGVHAALCDNIDTGRALMQLGDLVTAVNKYLARRPLPHGAPPDGLLPQGDLVRRCAEYVLRIVSVLGLVPAASDRLSSFNVDSSGGAAGSEAWRPFVDAFADFRETVRKEARGPRAKQAPAEVFQEILAACDRARDETLSGLGVRLEDRPDGSSTWKEEDPAVLAAERAQAKAAATAAAATKIEKQLKAQTAALEKLEAIAARPSVQDELAAKFSRAGWTDAEGYPAASADGSVDFTQPDAQKAAVKARTAVDKARKARAPLFRAQQEDGEEWRSKRQAQIDRLQQQLQDWTADPETGL